MESYLLYSLSQTEKLEKQDLYIKNSEDGRRSLDFFTYFNSFSISAWKQYTILEQVTLRLRLRGHFHITYFVYTSQGKAVLLNELITGGTYEHTFSLDRLPDGILGFTLSGDDEKSQYLDGGWYGQFAQWQEKRIGVGICTYKRESYVLRTRQILEQFQKNHPWLEILIVDNGSTLPEEKKQGLQVMHNPNFGGSGGFTRALLEYVARNTVDSILLMDDDIVLEPSVLERTYSLLCGLKKEYEDSFLSGAMLTLEHPCIQYENTAYWGKIRLHSLGKNLDLSQADSLFANEKIHLRQNQYGAWWYCCIPLHRVKEIGYPLPVFLKGDDMEYGIRNNRPLLHMNGIGVWHQSFAAKQNPVVNYYSDRNMLMMNHFAKGCNGLTFCLAVLGRTVKRAIKGDGKGLMILGYALEDHYRGLSCLTACGSDEKMKEIQGKAQSNHSWKDIQRLLRYGAENLLQYEKVHDGYLTFRREKLQSTQFWRQFLAKGRSHE